jgi:choline transport protein
MPWFFPEHVSQYVNIFYLCLISDSYMNKIYGVIFLGSTTAFSAMVSAAIIFLQTSCIIPQAILYRGRDRVLPERHFSLGKYGAVVNTLAVAWVIFLNVLYCFPTALPVSPQNMSYVSVVCSGLVGFVIVLWFTTKRKTFTGLIIDYQLLNERRMAAIHADIVITESETTDSSFQPQSTTKANDI